MNTGSGLLGGSAAPVTNILNAIGSIVSTAVPLVIALAVLYFLWSLLQYITKAGEDKGIAQKHMVLGVIVIAVMVSVWGLVALVQNIAGVGGGTAQTPSLPSNIGSGY